LISLTPCFCGSGLVYEACCGIYHAGGAKPARAEVLMRARYSAFVTKNESFLLSTWAAKTRPNVLDLSGDRTVWHKLEITSTQLGQEGDSEGWVEFKAHYQLDGASHLMHERSYFQRTSGCWFYVDGVVQYLKQAASEKPGKNAPCACGSGKKFKRCCGR
jgi:SEC-C motif domain protein